MEITRQNNKFYFEFGFSWDTVNILKKIGAVWNARRKYWHITDNSVNRMLICKYFPGALPAPSVVSWDRSYKMPGFLMRHQKAGIEIAQKYSRFGFWDDTGVGKTLMAIEIAKMIGVKTLVMCPLGIIETAWIEDIKKFAPELSGQTANLWRVFRGKNPKRIASVMKSCHIGLINYESFRPNAAVFEKHGFRAVIIDESSKLKNPKSATTKVIAQFCDNMDYVYLLSGTPAPNSFQEYWPQVRIIAPDLWGRSSHKWENENFDSEGYGGFAKVMKPGRKDTLMAELAAVSRVIRKEDVLDLPERTMNIRQVALSAAEKKAYMEMAKNLVVEISEDETIAASIAAVKVGKLRQITSGFVIDSESRSVHRIGKSKLNELMDLLEEIGEHQVIIWTQYQNEAVMISEALTGIKASWAIYNGTVSHSDKENAVRGFKSGSIKYIIAHPRSMGHGQTLTNCCYAVYYSKGFSYEEDCQSADRIYRYGQKNACSYYFLQVPGSIDEIIHKTLRGKKNFESSVFEYLKVLREENSA